MNIIERNDRVLMATEKLAAAPLHPMPDGFAMRWFMPGDEATWVAVQQASERYQSITKELFFRDFGNDEERLAARVGFLVDDNQNPIGTISAWNDQEYNGREYGRIHWVAVVPEMQGRGLGKAMMSAACARLLELGHRRAYLVTSTARVPAIDLYRAFGFEPVIRNDDERALWQELMTHLKPKSPHEPRLKIRCGD